MGMIDLSVNLCGVHLRNPVITASGTCGYGREFARLWGLDKIGGVVLKAVTLDERKGNPPPRVAETPSGMLNSVGLQNSGLKSFISQEMPWVAAQNTVFFANIAADCIENYAKIAAAMSDLPIQMVELNISCPNVEAGGVPFGSKPETILQVTQACKKATKNKPLMVKLSPNTADIVEAALAAQQGGADAVSLINTLTGMAIDVHQRKIILANVTGGLSGPAVRPVALRMVYQVAKAVRIPVVGLGGIMTGEDAIAFMLAGATAVQVGTASLVDPWACPRIVDEMADYCMHHKIDRISSIIGSL